MINRQQGIVAAVLVPLLWAAISSVAGAQYFGRNKVQYESWDWKVIQTAHFDIHYYPEQEQAVRDAARMAERWYNRLSRFFGHSFNKRKPIILYADQGDFQQTNTISGFIGEGTGGVTESLKNRVVLPFTGSYAEFDHVLGHELVHAFQYDIAQRYSSSDTRALGMIPLWFIEGMAEYASVGRYDPHTAMWLRDAMLRDDLPTLKDLTTSGRYFPYRYGQAFWSFLAGRWGDEAVAKAMRYAIAEGWDNGLRRVTGLTADSLSKEWIAAIQDHYRPLIDGRTMPDSLAGSLFAEDDELAVAPSVSPDGSLVAFLSTRDIFTIDLYLADAKTGRVLDKLVSADGSPHIDALRFINSAGTWSPDGRWFTFVLYSDGDDQLAIVDVEDRDIDREISIPGIGSITNPSYSPDGTKIVFSGSKGGVSDLYMLDIATNRVTRLTNDRHADQQPVFSPDGTTIAFVTDRGAETSFTEYTFSSRRLALYNLSSKTVTVLDALGNVKHTNPQYSPDGASIYFTSNHNGWNDVYRYEIASGTTYKVTHLATGVSGITDMSPAITVASDEGRMLLSVFDGGSYRIHTLMPPDLVGEPVVASAQTGDFLERPAAGMLPPARIVGQSLVEEYLNDATSGLPGDALPEPTDYAWLSNVSLDYLGTPTLGVAVDDFGTSVGSSISAYLSDMLGNHQFAIGADLSSDLTDFLNTGLQAQYVNRTNRWDWGILGQRAPFIWRTFQNVPTDTVVDGNVIPLTRRDDFQQTVALHSVEALLAYPLSQTLRIEGSGGYTNISYSLDVRQTLFNRATGRQIGNPVDVELPSPEALNLFEASAAYVGDNSYFAFTSPVRGTRYRVEAGAVFGDLRFATALADFRRYFFAYPFTLAFRGLHYGRYGADADNDRINPLFVGRESYVRGYSSGSFTVEECSGADCPEFQRLIGSRIGVVNLELRVPLFGASGFGLINFPYLPTELSLFADGGVAWTADDTPRLDFIRNTQQRVPVFSAGASARFNVLGYFVFELFYVYPFQRPNKGAHLGFQIAPGW